MSDNQAGRKASGGAQFVWTMGAIVATVALAAAAAWPIYHTTRVAAVAAIGLLIGAGAVLGAKRLKWRWWSAIGLAFGGYVLTVVAVAVPSAATDPGRAVRATLTSVAGIVTSWKLLLTVSLPAGSYQGVLVPFFVTVIVGSLVATALATSQRQSAPWAVAPLLAMVIFGAAFGTDATGPDIVIGPATIPAPWNVVIGGLAVIVSATWLVGRARIARSTALRLARAQASTVKQSLESRALMVRRQIVAGALVVVAIGAGVAAAPIAGTLGPRDALRESVDPVLLLHRQPSPLAGYRLNATGVGYGTDLFSISETAGVDRIRIATLDTYDGQTFHVGGDAESERFARQPGQQDARIQITIGSGYSGLWVPVVDATGGAPHFEGARAEALGDAYYASKLLDAAVVVTTESSKGVGLRAGDTYSVGTEVSTGTLASLSSQTGADPLVSAQDYPSMAEWVDAQGIGRSGADLSELVDRLRSRGYVSHSTYADAAAAEWIAALKADSSYTFAPSRSGHSAARVDELFVALLEQERRAGVGASDDLLVAAIGDDEQFATAAALLARYLGFESRVVIGVRVGAALEGSSVPSCVDTCTGANVTAWTEVRGSSGPWVALDATPQYKVIPTRIKEGTRMPENATEVIQQGAKVLEPPSSQSDATESSNPDVQDSPAPKSANVEALLAVLMVALAGVLLVLPLVVFPVAKVIRRGWRRRAGVPEVAMVGAWDELLDTYTDLGLEIPYGLTRAELADVLERPAAATLAAVIDRAVFAEHPPGTEESAATWDILTVERREVAAAAPWTRRLRAMVTPASFIRTLRAHRQVQLSPRFAGRTHHEL